MAWCVLRVWRGRGAGVVAACGWRMHRRAFRLHGALPRAIGVAVVAVDRPRRLLRLADRDAQVLFVRRDVRRLDLQRNRTELGEGWVTTVEQAVLDLAARPGLGGAPDEAQEAVQALLPRADHDLLEGLARGQRYGAALRRALGWVD